MNDLQQWLEAQKEFLSYEMLGRSLAYNPYPPRAFGVLDEGSLININEITHLNPFNFSDLENIQDSKILILEMKRENGAPINEGLESISYLRHYKTGLIFVRDNFIDPYQILQMAVYGADGVILDSIKNENLALAASLNLFSVLKVDSIKEVTKGILNHVNGFLASSNDLVRVIPKGKTIILDS